MSIEYLPDDGACATVNSFFQEFVVGENSYLVSSVSLFLKRLTSSSGYVSVTIKNRLWKEVLTSGQVLTSRISTEYAWIRFNVTPFTLEANTWYYLIVEYPNIESVLEWQRKDSAQFEYVFEFNNTLGEPILNVVSDHNSPSPSVGDHFYDYDESVTCSVTSPIIENGISYTCTGWTGTGSVPASGSGKTVTFTISQVYSTITWNWVLTEKILNGGFELSPDFVDWTVVDATISTSEHHSGAKCADITVYTVGNIIQVLATPIPREDVTSFTFWAKSTYMSFRVILTFTDDTTKYKDSSSSNQVWKEWDLLTMTAYGGGMLFPTGKTLKSIQIIQRADNDLFVDDVSLIC